MRKERMIVLLMTRPLGQRHVTATFCVRWW